MAHTLPGCGEPSGPPAGILVISLDTTRADHLSAYGYPRPTSPSLAALAAEGVRFDAAYAASASTAPSHGTLFTGMHPITHGVVKNGIPLADSLPTLAEILLGHGYQTAAVVSSFVLDPRFGFAQGFDQYDAEFTADESTVDTDLWEGHEVPDAFDRRADHTTRRALEWLEATREADRPFFLFVHYFDPHTPYTPPPGFARRLSPPPGADRKAQLVAKYDAEIAFMDAQVGRLLKGLDALGLVGDTLLCVTADHGEGLLDHAMLTHAVELYEGSVRIPLLLRWPGRIPAGVRIEQPVALADVFPTLLQLAGAPPQGLQGGRSLVPLIEGQERGGDRPPVFLHRRPYPGAMAGMINRVWVEGRLFGVRDGRWKLIESDVRPRRELYDVERDPGERHDLSQKEPERVQELSRLIAAWRERYERDHGETPALDAGDRGALEALGYIE